MDLQLKQSTAFRIPIRLVSSVDFTGVTGVTAPTVYIHKQEAVSTVSKSITNNVNWFEIDSTNFPGVYDLELSTDDTDTSGYIKVSVKSANSDWYIGLYPIIPHIPEDLYTYINLLRKINQNRSLVSVLSNTFTIYDDNGSTPLLTFDLKDQAGNASASNIYEKIPQTP